MNAPGRPSHVHCLSWELCLCCFERWAHRYLIGCHTDVTAGPKSSRLPKQSTSRTLLTKTLHAKNIHRRVADSQIMHPSRQRTPTWKTIEWKPIKFRLHRTPVVLVPSAWCSDGCNLVSEESVSQSQGIDCFDENVPPLVNKGASKSKGVVATKRWCTLYINAQ